MNVVISAAGLGTRFNTTIPKPLLYVNGSPMLARVLHNFYIRYATPKWQNTHINTLSVLYAQYLNKVMLPCDAINKVKNGLLKPPFFFEGRTNIQEWFLVYLNSYC